MSKEKIEANINEVLKDSTQENALDFIAYLGTDDMEYVHSDFCWDVKYKGESVCFIMIGGFEDKHLSHWVIWSDQVPGTWTSWADGDKNDEYVDFPVDEHIKEIAWANVNKCGQCGGKCSPGRRKTVLGKAFDNLCQSAMVFTNPDTEALDCAKKMIDARKGDISKLK